MPTETLPTSAAILTRRMVVDYFPEFQKPFKVLVPEATNRHWTDKRMLSFQMDVPADMYDEISDRLLSEGFDLAVDY